MPRPFGHPFPPTSGVRSFTLPEMMVAVAIFIIMLTFLLGLVTQGSRIWQQTNGQKTNRQVARILVELMGRDLESTVLPLNAGTNGPRFQLDPASLAGSGYLNPHGAFWQAARSGASSASGDVQDVGYFIRWVADGSGMVHGTLCRILIPPTNSDSTFQSPSFDASLIPKYAPGLDDTNPGSSTAYKGLIADNILGLWITLYDGGMAVIDPPYDSRVTSQRPAYADISIAMLDPQVAKRITPVNLGMMVTNQYGAASATNASSFLNRLPASIREGAQAFETRVPIHAGQ